MKLDQYFAYSLKFQFDELRRTAFERVFRVCIKRLVRLSTSLDLFRQNTQARQHRRERFIIALSLIIVLTGGAQVEPALARKPRITPEAVQQLLAARVACDTADSALFKSMKTVGEELASLADEQGGFPTDSQLVRARENLQKLVDRNEYRKHPILVQEINQAYKDTPASLIMVCDITLTDNQIRQYRQFPPDDWVASPGSIAVIYNNTNRFLIWGAGIEGKPLREPEGKVRLISISVERKER